MITIIMMMIMIMITRRIYFPHNFRENYIFSFFFFFLQTSCRDAWIFSYHFLFVTFPSFHTSLLSLSLSPTDIPIRWLFFPPFPLFTPYHHHLVNIQPAIIFLNFFTRNLNNSTVDFFSTPPYLQQQKKNFFT